MGWNRGVISSNVEEIGWSDDDGVGTLLVTWKSGRVSAYAGVDEGLADEVSRAPSVGSMLNTDIKPNFQHRYLR